ncbi:unknown [Prevotella sp. CAG:617]|nr:unknown [Prevotella sp. CAG:617]
MSASDAPAYCRRKHIVHIGHSTNLREPSTIGQQRGIYGRKYHSPLHRNPYQHSFRQDFGQTVFTRHKHIPLQHFSLIPGVEHLSHFPSGPFNVAQQTGITGIKGIPFSYCRMPTAARRLTGAKKKSCQPYKRQQDFIMIH